jgi:hypothetical protein
MALTIQTGVQAGQIAAACLQIQKGIADIQAALAAGGFIIGIQATVNENGTPVPLQSSLQMSVADTTTVLNALLTIYQNNLAALQSQLAGM